MKRGSPAPAGQRKRPKTASPGSGERKRERRTGAEGDALSERSVAFLRNLILSSVDGVIAADMTGKILIFNEGAASILGYSPEEGRRLNIRSLYPGQGARRVMGKLRGEEFGGSGKLRSYSVELRSKSGELIPISLNASIVREGGREVATIGFFHDMREAIRMKRELEQTQLQLLQSEKMASLGKLAAGVAHQLNNPLNGITLYTRLVMEEYELQDDVRKDLRRVLRDVERCRRTVRELLEFARQTRQEVRPQDVNRAISRTLFLLENQSLFQNIEIQRQLGSSLPQVPMDIQQIGHVLMNLILNAAEAIDGRGKLVVRSYTARGGDRVCIEISDTGPGIPKEVLPHIFEPFYTTKEQGKGTGLGLSMVYGIVKNHHGSIRVASTPGQGATFTVELPVDPEAGEEGGGAADGGGAPRGGADRG